MGKRLWIGFLIFWIALSAGLSIIEVKLQTTLFKSSMDIQKKITKPPKHFLYYTMKVFEWLLLGLTWGFLFLTLYFEFEKRNSWKILTFCWALAFSIEAMRILLKTAKPNFFNNTMAASGCDCYFGAPSWYAGFVVLFWCMFYKDILADRDFLEDSQKLIIKIVLFILVTLGIFARFFFGLETYNQIFLGIGFALVFFGLSYFDEFWENQFGNIFNMDSSSCVKRWLAFLIWIGTIADFVICFYLAKKNIKTFEGKKIHPFAKSMCKNKCHLSGPGRKYLSHNSLISMAWFSFVPLMFLYCSITSSVKYSNNQLNMIKYISQFKDKKAIIIKLILVALLCTPIIASAWYTIQKNWLHDLGFKFGMAVLWLILYRWFVPVIKKSADIYIMSDMFAPWLDGDDEQKVGLI